MSRGWRRLPAAAERQRHGQELVAFCFPLQQRHSPWAAASRDCALELQQLISVGTEAQDVLLGIGYTPVLQAQQGGT